MTLLTRRTALVGLAAGLAGAQGVRRYVLEERTMPRSEGFEMRGGCLVGWRGGALLVVEDNESDQPLIRRIGRDGELERVRVSIPDRRYLSIRAVDGTADGTLAVAGSAMRSDGEASSFLMRIEPDRQRQLVKELWPYKAHAVAFVPNGTIWTVGVLRDGDWVRDWNVLRWFDENGEVRGSRAIAVDRVWHGQVKGTSTRVPGGTELSYLEASLDRVGWLTGENVYLEFTFEGEDAGRWETPLASGGIRAAALRKDGEVIVGVVTQSKSDLWRLDRSKGRWEPVSLAAPKELEWSHPMGFDGETLIMSTGRGMVGRFVEERAR